MLTTSLVANPFCNKRTERDREKMGEKEREGEGRERVNSQYHRLNPSNAHLLSTVTPKLTDTTRK